MKTKITFIAENQAELSGLLTSLSYLFATGVNNPNVDPIVNVNPDDSPDSFLSQLSAEPEPEPAKAPKQAHEAQAASPAASNPESDDLINRPKASSKSAPKEPVAEKPVTEADLIDMIQKLSNKGKRAELKKMFKEKFNIAVFYDLDKNRFGELARELKELDK